MQLNDKTTVNWNNVYKITVKKHKITIIKQTNRYFNKGFLRPPFPPVHSENECKTASANVFI